MVSKARLLITKSCRRNCSYCCNNHPDLIKQMTTINTLEALVDYDEIMLTGGEPMDDSSRTENILHQIRWINSYATLLMYTARYDESGIRRCLPLLNGVQYTLHKSSTIQDIDDFCRFQDHVAPFAITKSFRLSIHPEIKFFIPVNPSIWKRVEVKPWMEDGNCPLPKGETLLVLSEAWING
jgi:hypothetical protein